MIPCWQTAITAITANLTKGFNIMSKSIESVTVDIVVSELVNGTREPIGKFPCFTPTLAAFGVDAEPMTKEDGSLDLTDDGFPQYEDNKANWLFLAVVNACKAAARNKLSPKSATLRMGASFVTTIEELVAPVVRTGSAALAERNGLFSKWNSFVDTLGKSAPVSALAKQFVKQPDGLITQPEKVKQAVAGWVEQFATEFHADLSEYQLNLLETVIAAASQDAADLEW